MSEDSNSKENSISKSDLVLMAVHQLRTPLSVVKWTLGSILNMEMGPLNEEQKKFLTNCYENNEKMIAQVNDMLTIDRTNPEKLQYSLVEVALPELIDSVLFDIGVHAKKKGIAIEFKNRAEALPLVSIDKDKMRVVLQNFLENAIKYTEAGGKIDLELSKENSAIKVSIHDSGIGIPKDEQKNIFCKFYRAENVSKKEKEGAGLGLFIVKNIIEGQGGKVWFESNEGEGTTFYFTIPIR